MYYGLIFSKPAVRTAMILLRSVGPFHPRVTWALKIKNAAGGAKYGIDLRSDPFILRLSGQTKNKKCC
jgi:hypothetical protein